MEGIPSTSSDSSGMVVMISLFWIVSIAVAGLIGYSLGKGSDKDEKPPQVLTETTIASPTPIAIVTPTPAPQTVCSKSGLAQKWDYLIAYTIQEGDTIPAIAEKELHNSSRTNEILQLNGVGPLIVGQTLYLPPKSIIKSTGNIKEVSGKLDAKDGSYWHLKFSEEKDSQGLLIPTLWFKDISDKDTYLIGTCVTILFDDGYKVFSVARQ